MDSTAKATASVVRHDSDHERDRAGHRAGPRIDSSSRDTRSRGNSASRHWPWCSWRWPSSHSSLALGRRRPSSLPSGSSPASSSSNSRRGCGPPNRDRHTCVATGSTSISCIPPVRWLRWFRLLRLLRLIRAFAGVGRALTSMDRLARHKGLVWLLVAWVAVMLLCAVGLYVAEHGVNKAIDGPLDALWWGLTTMTTVGYGDVFPVTAEGRLAAAFLMVLGIGLYSRDHGDDHELPASRIAAGPADLADQVERLAGLHDDGRLTDVEFAAAKAAAIAAASRPDAMS